MAFQPVAATCRVELIQSVAGQTVQNSLYFRQDANFSTSELLAVGGAMIDWWANNLAASLSSSLSLVNVTVTALHAATGPQVVITTGLPISGEQGADVVSNNVALCVSFRTALIGRSFRGRNYVPGLTEGDTNLSLVNSTRAAAIVASYAALISDPPPGTVWVVVSRTVNHVVQSPTALTNTIVSVQLVDLVVDSQRRRLPGRGT